MPLRDRHRVAVGALVALESLAFVAVGMYGLLPPNALPATAEAGDFSAERAFDHVTAIAREPHPIGSPANARVRDYIVGELEELGLEPVLQAIRVPDYYGDPADDVILVNVMAVLPGADPTEAVALMGHYDTAPVTPGASDDSAAVAAIVETARALLAGPPLRNDVILLFTDGEEPAPRYGSSAFVEHHPWASRIGLIVNFEAVGSTGPSMLVETSGSASWVAAELAEALPRPAMFSYLPETVEALGGSDSDLAPFREIGVPGLHFAYLHGSPVYHTAGDTRERVDLRSLQHHGSNALAVARSFGDLDLDRRPSSEATVYFSLLGRLVVRYPEGWALPSSALAALVVAGALTLRARGRERWMRSLLVGLAAVVTTVLSAAFVGISLWLLLSWARRTPGVTESYLYLVVLLLLSAAIALRLGRGAASRSGGADTAGGAVLVWGTLAVATGVWLPGGSYLFVWPALAGSLALAFGTRGDAGPSGRARPTVWFGVWTAPALVLLTPCMDTFFQLAQPRPGNPDSELTAVIWIVVALALLTTVLIRPDLIAPRRDAERRVGGSASSA